MAYLGYILRKIAQNPLHAAGSGWKNLSEYFLDRQIGVSTFRRDFRIMASTGGDSKPCQPAPYSVMAAMADHMRASGCARRAFVDVGCGAGRPLAYFSSLGFERMTGIEINPDAAELARENLQRIKKSWNRSGRIEVLTTDVLASGLDFTSSVLYLANPFGRTTMQAFAERLKTQLLARPGREILVYYVLPLHVQALLEAFPGAERQCFEGADPWQFLRLDAAAAGA